MKRRDSLKLIGAAALTPASAFGSSTRFIKDPKPSVRIAHLTDIHISSDRQVVSKFVDCLHHLQSQQRPADIVFNGGDCILDSLHVKEKSKVEDQWRTWDSVYHNEMSLEVVHCLGNHDAWAAGSKSDPLYGKKYALDKLQLEKPYYSFDRFGWHFIILDSTFLLEEGAYNGKLDEAQMDWLKADLETTSKDIPILVMSHIPILSATVMYEDHIKQDKYYEVPGAWMHIDFHDIQRLFMAHGNVKLCISGHMHLIDQVQYNNIHYACNGAVSGNWWSKQYYYQSRAGYAMIDLYSDGSFDHEFHHYDWS